MFTGLSRDYPGTVPRLSRPFPKISWEFCLCVSFLPQEKGKHINNLTPTNFRDNPATLFMFIVFFSPRGSLGIRGRSAGNPVQKFMSMPFSLVLEGGCLGRGLFVFHTQNHENHGNHEMKIENNPPFNTIHSSISRNHEIHTNEVLKTTPDWVLGLFSYSEAFFFPDFPGEARSHFGELFFACFGPEARKPLCSRAGMFAIVFSLRVRYKYKGAEKASCGETVVQNAKLCKFLMYCIFSCSEAPRSRQTITVPGLDL